MSTAGWACSLGLLAASVALAAAGGLAWLLFGQELLFAFSILGSALLGGGGGLMLVQRLDQAARWLRQSRPAKAA